MAEARMSGAEWLASAFAAAGTTHIFFVESVLRRTLLAAEDRGIKLVLAHSEKAAAYMADGYARLARRPGIAMAQSVGAANLAAGVQDPYLGRSPVIAITGRKPPSFQSRNSYQEVAHAPLFAAVTKFSSPVEDASDLPRLLGLAWNAVLSSPVRPVHLDLSGYVGDVVERGEVAASPVMAAASKRIPPHRPVADEKEVERAAAVLLGARRVVIVAGDDAAASEAGPELLALAEALKAPIASTLGAFGLVPTRHPLWAGVVGSYSAPPANRIVCGADLVLFVGCDTGDQVTLDWRVPALHTPIVQIEADPLEIGRSYPNVTGVQGDPKASLARLLPMIGKPERDPSFAEEAARLVADWREGMRALSESSEKPIRVERLCAEVSRALPENGILVADTGYSGIWTGTMVDLNGKGQSYLRAAGSLGWSFPAALGAASAAPGRKVLCFTGDGGFYYHLAELETARRCGIPATIVINNNSGFGQNLTGVHRAAGNRPGRGEELIRFGPTDFAGVAKSFGVRGIRVEEPAALAPALTEALAADETVVVDVVTALEPRAPEPWVPRG